MSIRHRFLVAMVALSATGVCVSSRIAYLHGVNMMQNAAMRQLTGIGRTRAYQIESYFQTVRNHVLTLSDDRMFIEGMHEFSTAYQTLSSVPVSRESQEQVHRYYENVFLPELGKLVQPRRQLVDYLPVGNTGYWLQSHYVLPPTPAVSPSGDPATTKAYTRALSKYDAVFRQLIDKFGYSDLLLIEPKDLRIIYSAKKHVDFGTSLKFGPYRDTPLARIVRKAVSTPESESEFVADFTRYEPIRGEPAAFIASPVFDGPTRIGVFVMQISTAEIDRVVSGNRGWQKDGLGRTGSLELYGPNHLMRSTSRSFLEHPQAVLEGMRHRGVPASQIARLQAYGTTILHTKGLPSVIGKGLKGDEGTTVITESSGRRSIVSYMPLKLSDLHWMLLAKIDLDEALAPVRQFREAALLWSLVTILTTIAVALLLTRQLLKPIQCLLSAAQSMSAGDLTARVAIHSRDELGALSLAFNKMAEGVQQSVRVIERKNHENENLLLNILPGPVAERLKSGETAIADSYAEVTVLFADIVGFTKFSSNRAPSEVIGILNGLFTEFDAAAKRHGIEKVKTIGDAYMAVAGLPTAVPNHARQMLEMAIEILDRIDRYARALEMPLAIRIGINSGPVAAGIVGTTKFIYDLWGDTVNIASRMESTGVPGAIQVSSTVYEALKHEYTFESRGSIEIKGKGLSETWLLDPRALRRDQNLEALALQSNSLHVPQLQ